MPPLTHTHQYVRVGTSKSKQFMCAHSECSHVISKKLLKGKKSICNKCSSEFILDSYSLKAAKPICESCRENKRVEHKVDTSKYRKIDLSDKTFDPFRRD